MDVGPRDIAQGTAFAAKRTGGKEPLSIEKIEDEVNRVLGEVSDELRRRSTAHMDNVIQPLPEFVETNGEWSMQGEISEGHIRNGI